MKILVLTPWFPQHRQDQHGNFILDSIDALINEGHQVSVLVTRPWRPKAARFISKNWVKKNIQVEQFSNLFHLSCSHYLSIPRGYFNVFSTWSYRRQMNPIVEKLINLHQCQVIHAHTEIAGVSAVDVGKKLGIPTVVTLHGISTEKKLYSGRTRELLFDYTLSNANRVILVGKPLINFTKPFVQTQDHFRIVSNGFRLGQKNLPEIKKAWSENQIRFISVSNLQEGKGIDINLFALAKLKKIGRENWTYNIVGDGSDRKKLEMLAKELNLENQVKFLGACNHQEVYEHLSKSDVFILPSYREAFGVAYVEAMSCGLLTIGVEGQGPQEYITNGKNGLLVKPNDIDSLTNTLQSVFEYPNQMHKIAEAGKNHVHIHFTWQCHAQALTKIYKELVKE